MSEIGYVLPRPYKIIAYMRTTNDIVYVQQKYGEYHPAFDATLTQELTKKITLIRNIFL